MLSWKQSQTSILSKSSIFLGRILLFTQIMVIKYSCAITDEPKCSSSHLLSVLPWSGPVLNSPCPLSHSLLPTACRALMGHAATWQLLTDSLRFFSVRFLYSCSLPSTPQLGYNSLDVKENYRKVLCEDQLGATQDSVQEIENIAGA